MATLKEIAEMANVSLGTVDRVIHNRGRVAAETAARVRRIVEQVNYRPNILARSLSSAKTFHFGILVPFPEQDGNYWYLPRQGIDRAAEELQVYKVEIEYFPYDKYDENSFAAAAQQVLKNIHQIDGLLIAPVLSKAAEKFITQLPKRLAYIFLDSYIPKSHCLSYIGEDSFQSGLLAAKLMSLLTHDGKSAVIKAIPFNYHIEDRVRGYLSYFESRPSAEVLVFEASSQDSCSFQNAAAQILEHHPEIKGIFCSNACSFQVAKAVYASRRRISLVGYDLVKENIEWLEKGVIDFLISQRSEIQGYNALYRLYRAVALKEKIEPALYVPLDIVTKENLRYYQN
ncbi:MAG: LacI family DNA-binding transcriptional regulator [candidate division KSB1 bacterium]|nr:LacI family DNA-binding transcriptional regulator [candidate division KSB1 bacterium]MDZ7345752.1 LacI family DNA-binding transcriptional regulator [candidate division KSB1 bacterium]